MNIASLVATYRAKLEMENPPEETANELRFAIESLNRCRADTVPTELVWKINRLNDMRHADNATENSFVPDRTDNALDSVMDALKKYTQEVPMNNNWLPIDSAPKDGTSILVYDDIYGVQMNSWSQYQEVWSCEEGYIMKPKCWQPLPLPPKGDE